MPAHYLLHFASTYEIPSIHRVSSSPQMQLEAYVKSSTLHVRTYLSFRLMGCCHYYFYKYKAMLRALRAPP